MTLRRSCAPALLGLALLPMLALAGCSAASPASPASHATSTAAAKSSASGPSRAKGTPITTGAQLCTLATAAEATSTLGTSKPIAELDPQDTNDGPACAYSGAVLSTTDPAVLVSVDRPEDGGIKDGRQSGLPLTLVPGLGQQAGVNDVEVDVILDKDHWLQIFNNNPAVKISRDQLVAFAKLLVSRY